MRPGIRNLVNKLSKKGVLWLFVLASCSTASTPGDELKKRILSTDGLVAFWGFSEKTGEKRKALGVGDFSLQEANGTIKRIDEGPITGYAAKFDSGQYMVLPWKDVGKLNINGRDQEVTVMAWVKWKGAGNSFIAGMWNEYEDGGKRQYGLFVSLPYYNGRDQVCGHISWTGKATPPFPYSIDYSASKQKVEVGKWACVAFTYDEDVIKSFYNGQFEERKPELIRHTKGFEGYPEGLIQSKNPYHFPDGMGDNGSDFTVGAVLLKGGMGNYFKGLLGGVAIFDRALTASEMKEVAIIPAP